MGLQSLVQHLRAKHTQLYKECQQEDEVQNAVTSSSSQAHTFPINIASRKWKSHTNLGDLHTQHIHKRLGEMITLDCRPFSMYWHD